jgi:hypothetical protein
MLALRLVRLIETHSEKLSAKILGIFLKSEQCSDLRKVPPEELHARTHELLEHVSDWLTTKTEKDIEQQYTDLGRRRAAQGVALSHFIWALGATREKIHDFAREEALMDSTVELVGILELMTRLDRFFDHAMYHACRGYEAAMRREVAHAQKTLDIVASF